MLNVDLIQAGLAAQHERGKNGRKKTPEEIAFDEFLAAGEAAGGTQGVKFPGSDNPGIFFDNPDGTRTFFKNNSGDVLLDGKKVGSSLAKSATEGI